MEQQFSSLDRVMESETISKNGASSKSQMSRGNKMKRVFFYFAVTGMAVILTGCPGPEGDPWDNPGIPSSPTTFTYSASAGSGGTISPSGSVLIGQGESRTFSASPSTGRIVNEWRVNGSVVATSGNSYTVTNVQSNGTIQVTFVEQGWAPESLQRGYVFETIGGTGDDGTYYPPQKYYWIDNTTHLYCFSSVWNSSGRKISTPYTYQKTGPNTATFNCSYILTTYTDGSRYESFEKGTLTYTSATECKYVYKVSWNNRGSVGQNDIDLFESRYKVYVDTNIPY